MTVRGFGKRRMLPGVMLRDRVDIYQRTRAASSQSVVDSEVLLASDARCAIVAQDTSAIRSLLGPATLQPGTSRIFFEARHEVKKGYIFERSSDATERYVCTGVTAYPSAGQVSFRVAEVKLDLEKRTT